MYRAVVFDLWQTLAVWPQEKSAALRAAWSASLGVPAERVEELWYEGDMYRLRETGPIAAAIAVLYETLGASADVAEIVERRLELTREALAPVEGAVPTLVELRRRGISTGLISNCTEEVALVWESTPFAGLFDVAVFSATAGCIKPEPEIYERALAELGVEAGETLFVGDGANDELRGARDVGMTPVLVQLDGSAAPWAEVREWTGFRITAIPHVLDLVA